MKYKQRLYKKSIDYLHRQFNKHVFYTFKNAQLFFTTLQLAVTAHPLGTFNPQSGKKKSNFNCFTLGFSGFFQPVSVS